MSRPAFFAKLFLEPLRALRARSAAAVGDSYARAAHGVLTRYERLEDEAAERRYRRRAQPSNVPLEARSGTPVAKTELS